MRFTSKSFHVLTKEQRQTIRSRFSIGQWKMAVANDKTIAGYVEWLANGIAASVDETVPYFDLDSRNNPVFISDRVSCSSKDGDFNHEFVGTVIGFKSNNRGPFYVEVRDQDGNVYDCDPSQVTIEEDLLEETKLQSRALGPNQAAALRALREHRVWHAGCGWVFGNRSQTERMLDSLVARGLVQREEREILSSLPTKHTSKIRRTVYTPISNEPIS